MRFYGTMTPPQKTRVRLYTPFKLEGKCSTKMSSEQGPTTLGKRNAFREETKRWKRKAICVLLREFSGKDKSSGV